MKLSLLFSLLILKKGSPYLITERMVPELIPVLGSQSAGDVSHKPGSRLPLLSARPAVSPAILKRAATNFAALVNRGTMGVNSLLKTVTRQRRSCDLNPGPSAPESTRPPSHPIIDIKYILLLASVARWCSQGIRLASQEVASSAQTCLCRLAVEISVSDAMHL